MTAQFLQVFFFAGLEGRNLSNSSTTGVSEVNVKFVTTWLNQ